MTIPKITEPLGRHWIQPLLGEIAFKEIIEIISWFPFKQRRVKRAVMTRQSLNKLSEYSLSQPTGCHVGKMWKCKILGDWWLKWFDFSSKGADYCSTKSVQILLQ